MPAPATTDWRVYLLSKLEFDVGTPVRLYGAIQASSAQAGPGLTFVLSKDLPFEPGLFPLEPATTRVDAPFGMTGVRLEEFEVAARLTRPDAGGSRVDLVVRAAASFPGLHGLRLAGALVLDQSQPRLALVRLSTESPLTLTQLIQGVLGGSWAWADAVTSAFAFRSGDLYFLKPPADAPDDYTWTYRDGNGTALVCAPGYHARAVLRILGEYDFVVSLDVVPQRDGRSAVRLAGTLPGTLDFDFVSLQGPSLQVSTVSPDTYLRISSGVEVFGTALQLSAAYATATGAFVGTVTTVVDGTTVGVEVTWKKESFRITRIIGLPTPDLDVVEQLLALLNAGGGCEKLVGDWLKGLSKTTLSLAMDGKPSKSGGSMYLPLKVRYDLKVAGASIASDTLPFTAVFDVPDGLSRLPLSIATSLARSTAHFAGAMLENPATYKAIALEAAKRGGASALARFMCRAAAEPAMEAVAAELAAAAGEFAGATLAEAAELAAALASVALLGLRAALNGILDLLQKLWDWITGKDEEKQREAEDQIRAQGQQIEKAMQGVQDAIDHARGLLAIRALAVGMNAQGAFAAAWSMAGFDPAKLGSGPIVRFELALLQGPAGTAGAEAWPGTSIRSFDVDTAAYAVPLADIPRFTEFRMNASVVAVATGITILSEDTRSGLQGAIDQLKSVDNGVARDVGNRLQTRLDKLADANKRGIRSDPVYATLQAPVSLVVGQALVGATTRLGTPG